MWRCYEMMMKTCPVTVTEGMTKDMHMLAIIDKDDRLLASASKEILWTKLVRESCSVEDLQICQSYAELP